MRIIEIMKTTRPVFSFEFFPPKSAEDMDKLFHILKELRSLSPAYISVTYGAGGGTRDRTLEVVERAKSEIGLESAAHLTCVGHSRTEVRSILDALKRSGIENVVALRGDPPKGEARFTPHPHGFRHASELTAFIRKAYPFCIAVAGYPEGHIESPNKETDWNYLSEKANAGADLIITQLFFENAYFYEFERKVRERGVTVPIVPGIMPITNLHQILRFTRICGATIPDKVVTDLDMIKGDYEAVHRYGVEYATRQCRDLLAHGVPGIHFYTLNKAHSTVRILKNLGLA
jgi:methylenetetrahydrofolate reductase (NADPH)